MTFEDFATINRLRCESEQGFNHKLSDWNASDWMVAVTGEVGEAANIVKKLNRFRDNIRGNKKTKEELQDDLRREIGDIAVYLDLMSQALGFSLESAMIEVFNNKSRELGFPIIGDIP